MKPARKYVKFIPSTTHSLTVWQQKQVYALLEKLFGKSEASTLHDFLSETTWNESAIRFHAHSNGRFSLYLNLPNMPKLEFENLMFGFAKRKLGLWCKHAIAATEKEMKELQKKHSRFKRIHISLIDDK